MSTTTSAYFPLATEYPYTGNDGSTAGTANSEGNGTPDNNAGASGGSTGKTFSVSNGALIAIILVVVIVALLGSKSTAALPPSTHTILRTLILHSCIGDALLHRQEEGMEGSRGHLQVGKESRHSPYAATQRVPQVREGWFGEVGKVRKVGKVRGRHIQNGGSTAHAETEARGS